jgi:hypothetical protein
MTFRRVHFILGKAGLALLLVIGVYSLLQRIGMDAFAPLPDTSANEIGIQIARAQCLLGELPQGVDTFGYLPSLPMRMEDPKISSSIIRLRGKEYKTLYLTQYALAPKIITFYDSKPWIIANYPDHKTGLEAIAETPYTIVKDCDNGVFLVSK